MMSRKHYKAIAEILNDSCHDKASLQEVAENLSDYFVRDNPLFSTAKFMYACGLDSVVKPKE